uniref:PAS domain-containing protein n=1 Tax=Haemonchus contortus TaxID=6289 RepID=A0A7I4Y8S8_HAECO
MMDQRQVIFREIDNLKQALPVSKAILEQQDRTSVLRVASTYLAMRNYFNRQVLFSKDIIETTSLILQALDGFCFILDERFHILYITESVSTHLGFSQVQMVGCCMSDFVHPEDFCVLNHVMSINVGVPQCYTHKLESTTQFTLRMTSKLPKRSCGFMYAGYKTILCTGFVRGVAVNGVVRGDILLASGQMIDRPGLLEVPLSSQQFLLRTTPDLCIVFCDARVGEVLRFNPADLVDRSLYHLISVEDCESLLRAHMMILRPEECQSVTQYVGMFCQGGGLATVALHLIKLPSNHVGATFSISIICTLAGLSPLPVTMDVIQFLQPFDTKESIGLGAHSSAFYADAMNKELGPSRLLPLIGNKRPGRKRPDSDPEASMMSTKLLRSV